MHCSKIIYNSLEAVDAVTRGPSSSIGCIKRNIDPAHVEVNECVKEPLSSKKMSVCAEVKFQVWRESANRTDDPLKLWVRGRFSIAAVQANRPHETEEIELLNLIDADQTGLSEGVIVGAKQAFNVAGTCQ